MRSECEVGGNRAGGVGEGWGDEGGWMVMLLKWYDVEEMGVTGTCCLEEPWVCVEVAKVGTVRLL